MTLAATPDVVATGRLASLTGRLTDPATGFGLRGAPVRLEAATADGSWAEVAVLSTDDAGNVTAELAPTTTTVYRLHYGDPASVGEPGGSRHAGVGERRRPGDGAPFDRRPGAGRGAGRPPGCGARGARR